MNRLAQETSPYLLQHAHNPVDWYAWKPEAFERAKAEQLPILVSIGYSTCHWCHVMERESFENGDVAAFMNEFFVNIKVDREERPDVDAIYMEACQILTGGGGWPLNVFLTPEGQPFYAGTYFPPRPAYNRPSWIQVLQHMVGVWQQKREVVYEQAEKLMQHIRRNDDVFIEGGLGAALSQDKPGFDHAQIYQQMRERFDRADGGFGGAPKFPSTMALNYLLQYHHATGDPEALEHVFFSLEKMIYGGIYDQLGGGFARYATDREWLVPHFEKMLYDNALLVTVMSEAYKLAATARFPGVQARADLLRETIEATLEYVAREMTHPEGGFYSAQDADSEGVEGRFFVWDKAEIDHLLGADAELFCDFYGVTAHGNWEEKNILWRNRAYAVAAADRGMPEADLRAILSRCRKQLFNVRSQRIWPGLDDKILLSWNALMASAYVQAYTALGADSYREAAVKNLGFLLEKYTVPDAAPGAPKLRHSWKNGRAQYDAFLEDYAFLIAALIDVYQVTFDFTYLQQAAAYTEEVLRYFFDAASGLFFFTDARQSDIVLRKKDVYDNATPSGNSTMVQNLQRLGILLDRPDWREIATQMLQRMQASVERYPLSFERWASAMLTATQAMDEIAVVGDNAVEKALALQRRFWPHMVIAASRTSSDMIPLLAHKNANPDAYIYVCRDFTCRQPVLAL